MADVPQAASEGMKIVHHGLVPLAGGVLGYVIADMTPIEEAIYTRMTAGVSDEALSANNDAKLKQIVFLSAFVPFIIYMIVAFAGLGYGFTREKPGLMSGGANFIGGIGAGAALNKGIDMLGGVSE